MGPRKAIKAFNDLGGFLKESGFDVEKKQDVVRGLQSAAEDYVSKSIHSGRSLLDGVIIQGGAPDEKEDAEKVIDEAEKEAEEKKNDLNKRLEEIRKKVSVSKSVVNNKRTSPEKKEEHEKNIEELTRELSNIELKNDLEKAAEEAKAALARTGFEESEKRIKEMEEERRKNNKKPVASNENNQKAVVIFEAENGAEAGRKAIVNEEESKTDNVIASAKKEKAKESSKKVSILRLIDEQEKELRRKLKEAELKRNNAPRSEISKYIKDVKFFRRELNKALDAKKKFLEEGKNKTGKKEAEFKKQEPKVEILNDSKLNKAKKQYEEIKQELIDVNKKIREADENKDDASLKKFSQFKENIVARLESKERKIRRIERELEESSVKNGTDDAKLKKISAQPVKDVVVSSGISPEEGDMQAARDLAENQVSEEIKTDKTKEPSVGITDDEQEKLFGAFKDVKREKSAKDFLIDLAGLIYQQKREAVISGKGIRFNNNFSSSFGKMSVSVFMKKNKEQINKLARDENEAVRKIFDGYNEELEKLFNEKKPETKFIEKNLDEKNEKESKKCLIDIFNSNNKLQEIFVGIADNNLKAEIKDFIDNYKKEKGMVLSKDYEDQKKFLELTKNLLKEIKGRIKGHNKISKFPQSADVSLPEEYDEAVDSELSNEERIGITGDVLVLIRKKEGLEKELEEVEKAGMDGVRIMRLQKELADIERKIKALESGEEIPEGAGIREEEIRQFQEEIKQMPAGERKKIGFGFRNMGFFAREWKSRKLAELCEFAAGESNKNRFLSALAETYRKDENNARKQIIEADKKIKGLQQAQNIGNITGGALKWGRTIADIAGWTAGSPLRYVTLGAQFFSRGAEAAKEARFKNEEVINKTRIKDINEAADEAWRLYEQAKFKATQNDGVISGEILNKIYTENLPEDLLKRLQKAEPGVATGILQSILRKDIEWAVKNGKVTKNSFELFLKDCDRLVGHYGEVDTLALGARYAQTAGKAVIAGVAVETFALLAPEIVKNAGDILHRLEGIWDGKESEIVAPIPQEKPIFPEKIEEPEILEIAEKVEIEKGDSVWTVAEKQLEARFDLHAESDKVMEVLKTFNVDKIKDAIAENPIKYGLDANDDLDNLSPDKLREIKWNSVFDDLKAENSFISDISELDGVAGNSILKNNQIFRSFFTEHPNAPRTSENYENILQGRGVTGEKEISYDFGANTKSETPYSDLIKMQEEAPLAFERGNNADLLDRISDSKNWDDLRGEPADEIIRDIKNIEDREFGDIKKALEQAQKITKPADGEALGQYLTRALIKENMPQGAQSLDLMDATQSRLAFQNIVKDKNINIEWAEKAGIKIEYGINGSERIKLYFLNDNKFNTAEDAKEFFELSEKINVDYHQSAFKEAFARLPEDFTSDQKAGYMKIFAGGNVQEGINDLLDIKGAHAKGVVTRGNVIEINDLIYNGKRMDIFISKDGKIGIDGEGIRLAVERKWLGLGQPKPTMEIDGDTIAMIRERIKSVLGKNKA
ncbi:MAG: hypothetical protein AAB906_00705 [Patescibacteria group bacterium]